MLIKVCGMRQGENIRSVEALGVDLMGFIFHRPSKRYVREVPSWMPSFAKRAGVFVNSPMEEVLSKAEEFSLDYVQLHGDEAPEYCKELRYHGLKVIKAFGVSSKKDLEKCTGYEGNVDYFLFDTRCEGYGGSGKMFDWSVIESYSGSIPFFLSGGIGPESCAAISDFHHPMLSGIDLNSRFETEPGVKNIPTLKRFIEAIRKIK